jgi:membrane protease YdiL (CAAX protease family)
VAGPARLLRGPAHPAGRHPGHPAAAAVVPLPAYAPNLFPLGLLFGLVAGLFEEPGWSGFADPRMRARLGPVAGAVVLGLLWGLWHLPVVDSLGAASPHGHGWPAFFVAFVLVLTSLRVLISWVYNRSGSLLLAQLLHASSTGFLVVLGPAHVTPAQEAGRYGCYGLLLGLAALVAVRHSSHDAGGRHPIGCSSKTRRPSAASTGWSRSTPSTIRMNQTPSGMPRA